MNSIQKESNLVKSNLPCDRCGSSDALALYDDGHSFCFSCEHVELKNNLGDIYGVEDRVVKINREDHHKAPAEFKDGELRSIPSRNISLDTCKFYGVKTIVDEQGAAKARIFPYTSLEGLPAQKLKQGKQNPFPYQWVNKSKKMKLFGQDLFPKGSAKYITITEGEDDALAAYEMTGSKYPVVSIVDGAQSARRAIQDNLEFLESFDNVVLCFDNDKPGREATENVLDLFTPGKAKVLNLKKHKDASDYSKSNERQAFVQEWWNAEIYTPEGLILSSSLKDKIKNKRKVSSFSYPWKALNEKTYGLRGSELVVFTAPPKVGKTAVLREISYHLLMTYPEVKIGGLFIEETPEISGEGLMALHMNKRIHLPDAVYDEDEWEKAYETILAPDRMVFFDAFGCNDVDTIIQRIRWMNKSYGCQIVLLDHISMLAADHKGDERKTLDYAALELKKLTMETGLTIIIVAHENREGKIHGTSSIEKLANLVVEMDRDKVNEDELVRNTLTLTVSYNRFTGDSGPAGHLFFHKDTGRLVEIEPEEFYEHVKETREDFGDE